jgi:large subunit ribosomal protein L15
MKLHDLKNIGGRKARKRVGRGDSSGWGKSAGRGDKGAGQRAGFTHRPHFEGGQIPLFRRLPKRGFNNPNHKIYSIINVGRLGELFDANAEIDEAALKGKGVICKGNAGLKILGNGDLSKALTVRAVKFSAAAREKIEAAGGKCEQI